MPLSKRFWSGCLFLAAASAISAAPPEKENSEKRKKAPEFVDVTRKVEVEFVEGVRSPDDRTHEVFVVLKNTSGGNLPGPLAIVFDEKKESTFSFDWYTDTLADGQQYFGLVDVDDSVPVKQSSRRRKVYLTTDAPVDIADRSRPEIPFRVIQLSKEHVASKQPVDEEVAGKKYSREEFDRVKAIQERAAKHLFSTHKGGVCGVFLGEDPNGNLNILVQVARRGVAREIPGTFEGVGLETDVSGEYRLYDLKPTPDSSLQSSAPAPTAASASKPQLAPLEQNRRGRIDRPICIGVSGINITDVCASGTIGCRVKDSAGNLYALSNNHVFSKQTGYTSAGLSLGNATVGEIINQPSPGDIFLPACDKPATNFLGRLAAWEPLRAGLGYGDVNAPVNAIDAAIATVSALDMGFSAPTDTYGTPSSKIQTASIGLKIQKMGRTTGWTKGVVSAINGIVEITYTPGVVRFQRQILTSRATSGTFSAGGDSGSLIVTQDGNKPVALLYAGSVLGTIVCPISVVLDRFNVVVDDGGTTFNGGHSGRVGTVVGPVNRGIRR